MRVIDRLTMARKVVVVVALGIALAALGRYLVSLGGGFKMGWYSYAALTARLRPPGAGWSAWLRLIIWLALTAVWALASLAVLRPQRNR